MTKVRIDPGICGFKTTVKVERLDRERVSVHMATACDQIKVFGMDIAEMPWREAFGPMCSTAPYLAASKHIRHSACPIPMAVIKAIEVEVGAALPQDVLVRFMPEASD